MDRKEKERSKINTPLDGSKITRMHAILASIGTDGDIFPYIGLARTLIERGHRVTLMLPQPHELLARDTGAEFQAIVTNKEAEDFLGSPLLWKPIRSGWFASQWGRPLIQRQFELISEQASSSNSILVANPGVLAARIVRDTSQVPLVSLVLQPGIIPSNSDPPVLPAGPTLPRWAPRVSKDLYWWLLDQFGFQLTGREVARIQREQGLAPLRRFFHWWLSPDRILAMFPRWYAPLRTDWPEHLIHVGFPQHDGRSLITIVDDAHLFFESGPPPILFTPGSEMRQGHSFFEKAINACRDLGSRGILLSKYSHLIPANLPEGIKHFDYLPFNIVFPRCSAVVHHGGIGTIAKALQAGIPQVIHPFAWDQFDNAKKLRQLGVSATLKRSWNVHQWTRSLRTVLTQSVQSKAKQVAKQGTSEDAMKNSVRYIEETFLSRNRI